MEVFLLLFVIVLIGVILIGSILGLTSSGRISKLEQQNRNLNARLKVLEMAEGKAKLADIAAAPKPKPKPVPETAPIVPPTPTPIEPAPQPVAASAAAPVKTSYEKPSWTPPKPSKPQKPTRNLEELIGGQWSVWVGGLALLVGAVLLIRFSIEAGFFGPTARIGMAVVLGVVLLLAGEWLKRSDDKVLKGKLGEAAKALQGNASVPSLLSAVGIFTLLGASYAAHELYGLIPALAAFAALAIISLGAMALSLRQGPLLAAIGLLASFATPLLIQTDTPSLLMLVVYLVLIGGAALALSRRTDWGWLATGVVFGWLGWSLMSNEAAINGQLLLWSAFLALSFVVTVWFAERDKTKDRIGLSLLNLQPVLAIFWAAMAAVLVSMIGGQSEYLVEGPHLPSFVLGLVSVGALIAASVVFKKQSAHLVTGGLLALTFLMMSDRDWQALILMSMILGVVLLAFHNGQRRIDKGDLKFQTEWSVFAIVIGLSSVVALDLTETTLSADKTQVAIALAYSALFAAVSVWVRRRGGEWKTIAISVVGAGLGWILAAVLAFKGLHFSLFMSLGAVIAALTVWRLRLPGARLVLLGLAGLVFAHALLVQFPLAETISTRPVFNALWGYLALPTIILGAAAYVLHRREEEGPLPKFLNGVVEAAALGGLALFAVFQIRHLSNGGEVYADSLGHAELGLQASIGLCFTLAGLSKRFAGNLVLSKIAEIISYVTLAGFALGSLFAFSPLFERGEEITGNLIFNSLTTGLLVPTILLGLCAVMARGKRPEVYINILGGLALAGALSWVTAMIRFIYNGVYIRVWTVNFNDMELWTISAVWLAFGIALLALGVWRRERALRIASGIVIILTVLKAFLIDMAGLEGVLRALSFVALGLILIVIGRAYQRYWLSDQAKEKEA
ncbi:MAG: DUF2339 domain-containing protein [Litorimonas sp.]